MSLSLVIGSTALEEGIRASFSLNAENYLEDDIHWGDDSDLIYFHGRKLQQDLGRLIDLFYPGFGPGQILIQILTKRRFFRRITAIDYSDNMLRLSKRRIAKLATIEPEIRKWVRLSKADLLTFDGHRSGYDMVICLNNTLGNIVIDGLGRTGREAALHVFHETLRPHGLLFLTVYNIAKMKLTGDFYTPDLRLLKIITAQDFLLEFTSQADKYLFYSHWFTLQEMANLIVKQGFSLLRLEERRERIIVCAEKK